MSISILRDNNTRSNEAFRMTNESLSRAVESENQRSQESNGQYESRPVPRHAVNTRLETNPYYHGGINE